VSLVCLVLNRSLTHLYTHRSAYALASEVRAINRRLGHLESLFQQQQKQANGQYNLPDPASSTFPQPRSFLDQSASSSANPSPANVAQNPPSPAHSDTENAVNELEDVAFSTRVPVLRAINAAAQGNAGKRYNYAGRVDMELTEALTSILAEPLTFDQDGRPRKPIPSSARVTAIDRWRKQGVPFVSDSTWPFRQQICPVYGTMRSHRLSPYYQVSRLVNS